MNDYFYCDTPFDQSCKVGTKSDDRLKDTLFVRFIGYADPYNHDMIVAYLDGVIDDQCRNVVVDLSGFVYVGESRVASILTCIAKRCKPRGGHCVIHSVQENVREVFRLLGLEQLFPIMDSEEDARSYIRSRGEQAHTADAPEMVPPETK